jgi:exodeoxyribonuclease X
VTEALTADGLIAHNEHVDVGVLQRKLDEWEFPEIFDTLKLARRLLPDAGSYKLGGLVEASKLAEDLPDSLTPHRATYDALVTARLFAVPRCFKWVWVVKWGWSRRGVLTRG